MWDGVKNHMSMCGRYRTNQQHVVWAPDVSSFPVRLYGCTCYIHYCYTLLVLVITKRLHRKYFSVGQPGSAVWTNLGATPSRVGWLTRSRLHIQTDSWGSMRSNWFLYESAPALICQSNQCSIQPLPCLQPADLVNAGDHVVRQKCLSVLEIDSK